MKGTRVAKRFEAAAAAVVASSSTAIRVIAITLMATIIVAVVLDFAFGPSDGPAELTNVNESRSYRGELILEQIKYDALRRMVSTDVTVVVKALAPDAAIDFASIRLYQNQQKEWDVLLTGDCTLIESGDEEGRAYKKFGCGALTFDQSPARGERAYPFDSYQVTLRPSGCVNERECLGSRLNLDFTSVTARAAHLALLPELVPVATNDENVRGPRQVVLRLGRRQFVQHLALILAAMSVIFFFTLIRVEEPKELFAKSLGFYGTLWALRSLIVPTSVSAFPTTVDYFVLTLFGLAFALVLYQLPARSGGTT